MDFSLVEWQGIPEKLMNRFYECGNKAGDFGTTKSRAESSKYNTIALIVDQEVVGSADLLSHSQEVELHGCYILPEYRGKLQKNGKSAFEHMAVARLERTELPARTLATTAHGKTQHVYDNLGFSPYKFELPDSEDANAYVLMADQHENRRFYQEVYAPESVRDFVDYVSEVFGQEADLREGRYRGAEVDFVQDASTDSYSLFRVEKGDQNLENAVNQVLESKEDSMNVEVDVDTGDPFAYRFIDELVEEGFSPTAFKPVVKGVQGSQNPEVHLGCCSKSMDVELVPETREFLEVAGWDLELINRRELSNEFRVRSV